MNTARVSVCLAILLCGTLVSPLLAQGLPGQAVMDGSPDVFDRFDNRRFQFRSDFGDGVGYEKGFQTFGAFQPFAIDQDELILWVNPRGMITYLGDLAANLGGGLRYYNPDNDRILGASYWFDHDNTGDRRYDQMGVSLESLGQYLDVRANAYLLTNDGADTIGSFFTGNNRFFQNFIGIGRTTIVDRPLNGGDFEVGGALPGIGDLGLRTYAGGYYYEGEDTGAVYGVRGRAEALITQDFWATAMVTHDRLFGTNVTGAVTWYYGSGQSPRWFQRIPVQDRMYQQVERQYRIAVWRDLVEDTVLALRAGGTGGSGGPIGTPIFVVHVDNTAPGGGDGTVENPYNFLPTTTPGNVDIVFVNRGNGTASNMSNGITLNDYQRLLGEGVQHAFTSTAGMFMLPGYTPGPLPTISNPAGDVVRLASFNEVSGFNISGAGRHGIYGLGVNSFNLNNLNITNNGTFLPPISGAGIQLDNAQGLGQVFDVQLVNNAAEGMRVDNVGTTLELRMDRVSASQNLTGIALNGSAGANYNVMMTDVNASSNRHDGIAVVLEGGSTFTGVFDRITANNNNRPEDDIGFGNGFFLQADASTVAVHIEHSNFNNNNLNGLSFVATNGTTMGIDLVNNNSTISNNLLNGLLVDGTDSNIDVLLKNNVFQSNGGKGVFLDVTNGSLDLFAGGLGSEDANGNGQLDPGEDSNGNGLLDRDGNVFDNNVGAGLAYKLNDSAVGTLDIRGNIFTRQQNDANSTIYLGQGIDVRLDGSSISSDAEANLTAGIIDFNTVGDRFDAALGNAGSGIVVFADQRTRISQLQIGNTDLVNGNGNTIAHNRRDGIEVIRRNEAVIDNFTIADNRVSNNVRDGISITARNSANDVNNYEIHQNLILNNGEDGVSFFLAADAQIEANMTNNLIQGNTEDGIESSELVNTFAELRFLTGDWQRNVIQNNGGSGLELNSATSGLLVGSIVNSADGNLINNNGTDGIEINGSGSITIGFNEIANNGTGGIDINPQIANNINSNINITRNYIHDNSGDGIEILSEGAGIMTVSMTLNTIRDNTGRGVDILNKANSTFTNVGGTAFITLNNNLIVGNELEGVYVINTASSTQNQSNSSTDPLNADGVITTNPRLTFTMIGNRVEGNGLDSDFSATGLVLRVGTSGGGYGPFTDGGFFSEGRGGVGAEIRDNIFSGNLGHDIYFDSFTSTVDPINTAGTWSATEFTITAFQGDPLARLDLRFTGNTFDSASVNNAGAFYDNAEAAFKSRQFDATDPGPFLSGSRQRNAQRLGARFGLGPATPGGASDFFLYSGIGQSTFRLLEDDSGIFIEDDFYTDPFTDANGVFTPGPFGPIEHMPYGWNALGGGARPQ